MGSTYVTSRGILSKVPDPPLERPATSTKAKSTGRMSPALCNVLGSLLIVAVAALALPLGLSRLMGYQMLGIVTSDMAPAIPGDSVIYVQPVDPADVQVDEVVAFRDGADVLVRRVVENQTEQGQLVTKGDALPAEDPQPMPYESLVGAVALTIPFAGSVVALYTGTAGKVCLALALACGIALNMQADRIRRERGARRRRGAWVTYTLMAVLALVFAGSAGVVAYINGQHKASAATYASASSAYTLATEPIEGFDPTVVGQQEAPKHVDFAALTATNPDVVGWIYCPDTIIDYPVLRGETNDTYLRHDYTGEYNINGSIFVDSGNRGTFEDANTIVYGHHMSSGDMFACLDQWADQEFYEQHPVMWLLTPTQDYQVVLVSGHHVSAYSDMYRILPEHDEAFAQFLASARESSDFVPVEGADADPNANYVMLSTCAYIFDDARYVLHGKLVPLPRTMGT